jgi:Cu(I)/Ag(I) efflux system membrane fusion protein
MGSYVFRDLGDGHFLPVMVKTGLSSEGFTEIISGLSDGQYVVTSGQSMLDAESNLRGGMANMPGMDMGTTDMKNMPMPADDGMKGMDMGNGHGK